MYAVYFASGEHETFRCLACAKTFVSKRAIGRHFDREPAHDEVTITAADIETRGGHSEDEGIGVPRGVARRRLLECLTRDRANHSVGTDDTDDTNDTNNTNDTSDTRDSAPCRDAHDRVTE